MPDIKTTLNPSHLGDGAYIGQDPSFRTAFWLGANDHRNMTVCLGSDELTAMLQYIVKAVPEYREHFLLVLQPE